MVNGSELASEVYAEAMIRLADEGLPQDLLRDIPELESLMGGYWAMVGFLAKLPAMVVGDRAQPSIVVSHMSKEREEAMEVLHDFSELELELGDTMFLAMVVAGLLWGEITPEEKHHVKETIVWSMETSREKGIDLAKATKIVAEVKNPNNYLEAFLQIRPGETVEEVMERLPGIYATLRRRRQIRVGTYQAMYDYGYSHVGATSVDDVTAGGRYDS